MDRYPFEVIVGRVEADDVPFPLHQAEGQSDEVAPKDALAGKEKCHPKEHLAQCAVVHTLRLEDADHLGAFEDDDEQAADHREGCHHGNEYQDDPHVGVQQGKPGKDGGVQFFDGLHINLHTLAVHKVQLVDEPGCIVHLVKVFQRERHGAVHVFVPTAHLLQ